MAKNVVIYVIYAAGFMDLFGVSMTVPLLTKHARDIGASPVMAGLIGSVYGFLQLFSAPLVGRWSDVAGRKMALLCCLLMSTIGYSLLVFGNTVLVLALARIPTGLFKHSQELSRAYLADVTPISDHPRVFGKFNSISNIGFIIGPVVGGHIVDGFGGFSAVAVATAAIFLLNLLLICLLLPSTDLKSPAVHHSTGSSISPWQLTRVYDVMLSRFLLGAAVLIYRHDYVSTVIHRYDSSATVAGYVTSLSSCVGTATGLALVWSGFQQEIITAAIDQWRRRFSGVYSC